MARWAWGGGSELGRIDHYDVRDVRIFDGDEEILDWVDFVDEDAGIARVMVTDPPGIRPTRTASGKVMPDKRWKFNARGDVVREMLTARSGRFRVVLTGEK